MESSATAARPSRRGLSPSRLARMHDVMRRHVDSGRPPGLVALISRRGEEHVEAIGTLAFDRTTPMRRDTMFRRDNPVTAESAGRPDEASLRLGP